MTASISPSNAAKPADVEFLYRAHARHLELIVRHDVHEVSEAVIEDACQFAWSRLVVHAARIRGETALSWLARTAVHEAFKLIRRQAWELPLQECSEDEEGAGPPPPSSPDSYELIAARDRLALTAQISARQGRIVWLHALGLSYQEISDYSGDTPRTVQRQLLRGRSSLRALGPG